MLESRLNVCYSFSVFLWTAVFFLLSITACWAFLCTCDRQNKSIQSKNWCVPSMVWSCIRDQGHWKRNKHRAGYFSLNTHFCTFPMWEAGLHHSKIVIHPDGCVVLCGGIIPSRRLAEMFFSQLRELKTWKSGMWTSAQKLKPHLSEMVANSWNGFSNSLLDTSERDFSFTSFLQKKQTCSVWSLHMHSRDFQGKTFRNFCPFISRLQLVLGVSSWNKRLD